ncbi:hypothetical protein KGQ33_02710 [Patescibacteria group bacterium]|nr:hypothetical protein [Patescibacteria group bacterium]
MNKKQVASIIFLILAFVLIAINGIGFNMGTYIQMDVNQKILVTLDAVVSLLWAILFMLLAIYFKDRK